jgi:NADP-dependent 3-hydroxy acid dehydrogenase YdfG
MKTETTMKAQTEPLVDYILTHSLVNNAGGAIGTERAGDIKLEDIDFMVNTNRTKNASG